VVDPVAIPKPAPTAPATTLASVPRTPVSNRPTNQIMMVRTTAYTHTESDHVQYGRKSAAGNTLQYGSQVRSAAADWSKYPLGTRFMIEGLPYEYVVDDYGSALVGTETIDIYKPEKGTMNNWGVRNVPIRVLEWGSFEESRKILDGRKHVRHADHVREMLHEIEKKGRNGSISLSPTGTSA
jgi:3D (Asp-Asp-Asp) domain-containing protein